MPSYGYALRAGFRREAIPYATAWPAASAAALTQLLPLLGAQPNDGANTTGTSTVMSGLGNVAYDLLHIAPLVQLPLQMRYQGLEDVWACALGHMAGRLSSAVMPQTLAPGAYRHLYEVDALLGATDAWDFGDGFAFGTEVKFGQRKVRRGTLALDFQTEVWEFLSCMVTGWTLAAAGDGVTLTVDWAAHSKSTSSVINTSVTMGKLLPPWSPRLRFDQMGFRIAPYSAGTALNSGNAVQVTSWTLRVDNQLEASFGPRTGAAPDEYERTHVPLVTLTVVLPRHEAATWESRWTARTVLMADAKWTGPAIGSTGQNYQCNVYLPSLQVSSAQLGVDGPGLPADTVQLLGVLPSAAAAGFPAMGHLGPLAVEVVSGAQTHPLTAA